MSIRRITQFFEPWPFQGVSEDPKLAIRELNDRLRDLSNKYSVLTQLLSFGPVPGAYITLPFFIRDWDDASTAVAAGETSAAVIVPVECVPMAFSASTVIGSATVQLLSGVTELLTADLDTNAAAPYVRRSHDFTANRIEAGAQITMRVETPTGGPLAVQGLLIVNQLPKVQQP